MIQQPPPATNVFDAAKAIAETLKHLDKQQQEQAIRYSSDSLGLGAPFQSLSSGGPSTHAGAQAPSQPTPTPVHSTDIRAFTAAKAPKSDQQFAAVVAYFYQLEAPEDQRKDAIGMKDLKDAARLAKRRVPGRFALNNAKNSGYLDSAGRGNFKLSTVGENLVSITLPGGNAEVPPARGGGKKRGPIKHAKKKGRPKRRA